MLKSYDGLREYDKLTKIKLKQNAKEIKQMNDIAHVDTQLIKRGQDPATHPAAQYLLTLRSKKSRETMLANFRMIARAFNFKSTAEIKWTKMQHWHIELFINNCNERGLSPNTINTCLAAIKGVMRQAWLLKQIDTETYQRIKDVKGVRGSRVDKGRALKGEEIITLLDQCLNDKNQLMGARDAAIIMMLAGCGLRRAEIVALNVDDYNAQSGELIIYGKGNRERISQTPKQIRPFLNDWLSVQDLSPKTNDRPRPLFTRIRRHQVLTGERLSAQGIYDILRKRGLASHLKNFTPHDFRRTFATLLFDQGEDIRTVQLALGHQNIETTKLYDKRGEDRKNKAVRDLSIF